MSRFALARRTPAVAKAGRLVGMATVLGGTAALLLIGAPADAAAFSFVINSTGI